MMPPREGPEAAAREAPAEELTPGWTVFRLPRSHYHATWENFVWDGVEPRAARAAVLAFWGAVCAGAAPPPHLVLAGPPGTGKTHLSVAVYRAVCARMGTAAATWLHVPAFCAAVRAAYGTPGAAEAAWADVEAATRLVVLDDLAARALSAHERDVVLYRLIDTASRNGAAVLVTLNAPAHTSAATGVATALTALLGPHEISRLLAGAAVVAMTRAAAVGADYRRRAGPAAAIAAGSGGGGGEAAGGGAGADGAGGVP